MSVKGWFPTLAMYSAALLLCAAGLYWTLDLRHADLRYPLRTGGDCAISELVVKNIIERGAFYRCDRIAAPYGMDMRDFPMPENLQMGFIRLLSFGSKNSCRVVNYYYLLTYYLIVVSALFALRQLGMARLPAVAAALLYAFLPYHAFRGVDHLFLSGYYIIPLATLAALWVYQGKLSRLDDAVAEPRTRFWCRWAGVVLIALLSSATGAYYAFFSCYFLLAAGLACALRCRRWRPLLDSGVIIGVVCLGFVLNLAPCLLYQHEQGANPDVGARLKMESELYGLRLSHLLLPVFEHRLHLFRTVKELYSVGGPWPVHEGNYSAALGTVGSLGFVGVVIAFLFGQRPTAGPRLVIGLGMLTVAGFLLGTVGGVGALFANYVSPQIRAYNRVSICLGFFALCGVALFLTRVLDKAGRWGRPGRLAATGLCLLVLAGGMWDETTPALIPASAANKTIRQQQLAFVGKIEESLPPGAMIFQFPFVNFPETPIIHQCGSYDHFRMYLVSHTTSWSHGTMMGRYGGSVLAQLSRKPLEQQVEQLAGMGYSGIHLDRYGYPDHGKALEDSLRALLKVEPLVSDEQRDVFFTLLPYQERMRSQYSAEEWEKRQQWYRYPVVAALWEKGADRDEGGWRWCRSPATLNLVNPCSEARTVTLCFHPDFATVNGKPQEPTPHLMMTGAVLNGTVAVDANIPLFSKEITVPPGKHALRFDCDGQTVRDVHGRNLVFRLLNLEVVSNDTPFSDVRLSLSKPGMDAGIEGNTEVTLSPSPEGLVVQASGADPNLLLPACIYPPHTKLEVHIELTSPADTVLELFYKTRGTPAYTEKQTVSQPLSKGRNVVDLKVTEPNLMDRLRLDPGTVPGRYILHAVEVRALPREE
jgi:phosphoglycerol transferase